MRDSRLRHAGGHRAAVRLGELKTGTELIERFGPCSPFPRSEIVLALPMDVVEVHGAMVGLAEVAAQLRIYQLRSGALFGCLEHAADENRFQHLLALTDRRAVSWVKQCQCREKFSAVCVDRLNEFDGHVESSVPPDFDSLVNFQPTFSIQALFDAAIQLGNTTTASGYETDSAVRLIQVLYPPRIQQGS